MGSILHAARGERSLKIVALATRTSTINCSWDNQPNQGLSGKESAFNINVHISDLAETVSRILGEHSCVIRARPMTSKRFGTRLVENQKAAIEPEGT